ncbi:hypothetical protein ABZP36_031500 [Zizania latifolia]
MGGSSKKQCDGSNGKGEKAAAGSDGKDGGENNKIRLPIANLVRLMKKVLPGNAKIGGTAKCLTHDCVGGFVGFVSDEASERVSAEHRRTVGPDDWVGAFHTLGFDRFAEPMTTYIHGYRDQFERTGGNRRVPPQAALPPGAPVTFTDEELQFLRSVIPSPSNEESMSSPAEDGHGYGENM